MPSKSPQSNKKKEIQRAITSLLDNGLKCENMINSSMLQAKNNLYPLALRCLLYIL